MDFVERLSGSSWTSANFSSFLKFSNLDSRVQHHLQKVYATLACAIAVTALGVYADFTFHIGGLLTFLVALGCMIGLTMPSGYNKDFNMRYGLLAGFSFCQGCSISPLVNAAISVNPGLLITAIAATSAIFLCFTASALMTQRRAYLFLGGWLSSALMGLLMVRLGGFFLGASAAAFQFELMAGVLIFSGYVLLDTQLIVERASAGEMDHVRHAMDLLVDLLALFVRILVILMNSAKKDEEERNKKRK